jgi:DNA-binding CsgD family transcriptional regulator
MSDSEARVPPLVPPPSSPGAEPAPAVQKRSRTVLTEKQRAVYDLKLAGRSYKEIGAAMGISTPVVSKVLVAVKKKLGIERGLPPNPTGVEVKNPERAAAVIDAMTDPRYENLKEAYKALGIAPVGYGVIRRLRVKFQDAITETRALQRQELSDMVGKKIHLFLSYMDDKVAAEASARDLAMGVSQLIEKKQLIDGQPTQIISDHERKKLHELLPLAIAEAQRRGLTIEGNVTEKTVEPA